jgi:DNA-binding NtrC family response regulator
VGGEQTLKVDVRVLAATNQDLTAAVAAGRFREDLYFRLAVVPLKAPPLRERSEDIPLLCQAFVQQCARENGLKEKPITPEALAVLSGFEWPGNVRELRNVIERLVILSEDGIGVGDLPEEIVTEVARKNRPERTVAALDLPPETRTLPLRELRDLIERQYIMSKLDENGWNISRTAQVLEIERTNLHKKMRALGISRDDRRESGQG